MADGETPDTWFEEKPGSALWAAPAPSWRDEAIPDVIGTMSVTDDVRELYRGYHELLYFRASLSDLCRKPFDAVNLCMRRVLDPATCKQVRAAWRPCEDEIRQKRLENQQWRDRERRRLLMKQSRAMEMEAAARAGRAASQAKQQQQQQQSPPGSADR